MSADTLATHPAEKIQDVVTQGIEWVEQPAVPHATCTPEAMAFQRMQAALECWPYDEMPLTRLDVEVLADCPQGGEQDAYLRKLADF